MRAPSLCLRMLHSPMAFDQKCTTMPTMCATTALQWPSPVQHPIKPSMARSPALPHFAFLASTVMFVSHLTNATNLMHTPSMAPSVVSSANPNHIYNIWVPTKHKFIASHDVIVYEKVSTSDNNNPLPPATLS